MPTDLPVACSLSAAELPVRLAEMSAIGREALLGVERDGGTATLRFRSAADTQERLSAIVAAEAQCCAFLEMTLEEAPQGMALTIKAPVAAESVLDDLVSAFSAGRPEGMSRPETPPRSSTSILAGGAVLMVLCCAIGPAAIGAAAGGLIGGWLGVACAVVVAAVAVLLLRSARGRGDC
jgi:hypothetical protein